MLAAFIVVCLLFVMSLAALLWIIKQLPTGIE